MCRCSVLASEKVCGHCGWVKGSLVEKPAPVGPFDPRTEVSADARHVVGEIVKYMWIIPIVYAVAGALVWLLIRAAEAS